MARTPKIKLNQAELRRLEKDMAAKMPQVQVDRSRSEAENVAAIERQLRGAGVTPNRSEIQKLVRDQLK